MAKIDLFLKAVGSNSRCHDVFRVKIALSSTWSDLKYQRHPPWKNRTFSAGRCNFSFKQDTDIIPTVTSIFSTTADLSMTKSMSSNIVDYGFSCRLPKYKMAAIRPEVEITFER